MAAGDGPSAASAHYVTASVPAALTRVRGADYREMRESYERRCLMEERSLQLEAPFSRELADGLTGCAREMALAVEAHDAERYVDQALMLHRRIIAASGTSRS